MSDIYFVSPYPKRQLWKKKKTIFKLPPLTLYLLKGLTPPRYSTCIIDESTGDFNFTAIHCCIVCISLLTSNAERGFLLAKKLAKTNTVVCGGIHASALPKEISRYAHAVCVGEIEHVWPAILRDIENTRLKAIYFSRTRPYANDIGQAAYIPKTYVMKNVASFSRGCPFNCSFCSVSRLFGQTCRRRPVSGVYFNLHMQNRGLHVLLDDNIVTSKRYIKQLCASISRLRIKWVGQAPLQALQDSETVAALKKSGCIALLVGIETVAEAKKKQMEKLKNVRNTKKIVDHVKAKGILLHGSFIFGFDGEHQDIFTETLAFADDMRIDTANFSILVPYPGTRIYRDLYHQNRLFPFDNWNKFDRLDVLFDTRGNSAQTLKKGILWMYMKFYSFAHILRNVPYKSVSTLMIYIAYSYNYKKGTYKYAKML